MGRATSDLAPSIPRIRPDVAADFHKECDPHYALFPRPRATLTRRLSDVQEVRVSNRGAPPARGPRINSAIRVREVRLIGEDGSQLGIMPTQEALRRAEEADLDLVEVQPGADPPVCRLMDYGRHKYEQERKDRESRKAQKVIALKEVRLRPKTDDHDLETYRRHIRGWLSEGNRVQLTVRMCGREQAHPDVARKVLADMAATLADVGHIERDVLAEGRTLTMILAPGTAPQRRQGAPSGRPAATVGAAPGTTAPSPSLS